MTATTSPAPALVAGAGGLQVPALVAGLLDDAAIFPPGNAPMDRGVAAHAEHLHAPHAALVGPFVCSDARWRELALALASDAVPPLPGPLDVSLVVTGGAPAVAAALAAADATPGVRLVGLEVPVSGVAAGPRDVAATLEVLRAELPDTVLAFVEVPLGAERDAVLDRLAGTPHRAKLRTGGTTAAAFPDEPSLAAALLACLQRGLPVKLTAGLHNALRHRDAASGFEHHGFLNVLLAVAAGLGGAAPADVARQLALTAPDAVTRGVRELSERQVADVRRHFLSFGTCSIDDPVTDLLSLGLLTQPAAP